MTTMFQVFDLARRRIGSRHFATLTCYMLPRAFPFLVVLLITYRFGSHELGLVALVFSIISFVSLATDWGVSQWLLTTPEVNNSRKRTVLIGRLCSTVIGAGVATIVGTSLLHLHSTQVLLLNIGILGSFFQMSFAFLIHGGKYWTAMAVATLEYVLTPLVLLLPFDGVYIASGAALLAKAIVGIVILPLAMASTDPNAVGGMPPSRFGTNHALWALTSIGSGTGELAVLAPVGPGLSGPYRLLQTASSAGSIVGSAVQAPLLGAKRTRWAKSSIVILGVSLLGVSLAVATTTALLLKPWQVSHADPDYLKWASVFLILNAGLSSVATLPATFLTRRRGSRPLLISGIVSATVYWSLIFLVGLGANAAIVPTVPVISTAVGIAMNLIQLKRGNQ